GGTARLFGLGAAGACFARLRGNDQPAALSVLALPCVLDVGEWNQFGVYPELATRGAGHDLLERFDEDIAGRDAGVPRIVRALLRSAAAGSEVVGPALSPTWTRRLTSLRCPEEQGSPF